MEESKKLSSYDPSESSLDTPSTNKSTPYWCFISYRHADNLEQDRNWASWLHQEIERYEVPAELVGRETLRGDTIPERIYPVFRDEESLPADADLGNSIVGALDRSRFLVALCSPRAVASQYVEQEIAHFIDSGKGDQIIAAILAGEPGAEKNECFPLPLREIKSEDGTVSEPIAADFRLKHGKEAREGFTSAEAYRLEMVREAKLPKKEIRKRAEAYENQLQLMKLKIIAGILGVPLEELRDRDKAYQLELARRRARITRRVMVALAILLTSAVLAGLSAIDQRKKVEIERDRAEGEKRTAQVQAGKGWLLKAENSHPSTDSLFFAGRAIGFANVGKPDTAAIQGNQIILPADSSENYSRTLRKFWKWITPQKVSRIQSGDQFPQFISSETDAQLAGKAYQIIDHGGGAPFLWSSPTDLHFPNDSISSATFSPDGKTLATGCRWGMIKLWDTSSGSERAVFNKHERDVHAMAFSPDSTLMASGSSDCTIMLWDVVSEEYKKTLTGHTNSVWDVAFSPDGLSLASADPMNYDLALWDVTTGKKKWFISKNTGGATSLAFSSDGAILVTGSKDKTIRLWESETGRLLETLTGHEDEVLDVTFSPDGQTLASAGRDGAVLIWDFQNERRNSFKFKPGDRIHSVSFSPDGQTLVTGSYGDKVKLWDLSGKSKGSLTQYQGTGAIAISPDFETLVCAPLTRPEKESVCLWSISSGEKLTNLTGHQGSISHMQFGPDGRILASTEGNNLIFWNLATGQPFSPPKKGGDHYRPWNGFAFNPNGKSVAVALENNTISVFEIFSDTADKILTGHNEALTDLTYSPDGETLASSSVDGKVIIWSKNNSEPTVLFNDSEIEITGVTFSMDGKFVASASNDGKILVWDTITTEIVATLRGEFPMVFSPSSNTLAYSFNESSVKAWDIEKEREIYQLSAHRYIREILFTPDGQTLCSWGSAAAANTESLKVWDLANGSQSISMSGFDSGSIGEPKVSFSPDGQLLAGPHKENSVAIWDISTGKPLSIMRGHSDNVSQVAFSPDATILASSSRDGTIKLWDSANQQNSNLSLSTDSGVDALAFSTDGKTVAAKCDADVYLWDVRDGREKGVLTTEGGSNSQGLSFSPDGTLAATSEGNLLELWNSDSKERKAIWTGKTFFNRDVAFSANGKFLASGGNPAIEIWEIAQSVGKRNTSPAVKTRLSGHSSDVRRIVFSPNGEQLASASDDNTVRVWDIAAGREAAILSGHSHFVTAVAYGPDGTSIASGSWDNTIKLWDLPGGIEKATLKVHKDSVNDVSFSPDGTLLASASSDKTINLWNLATGTQQVSIRHPERVFKVAFSPDGKVLAAGTEQSVTLYEVSALRQKDLYVYLQEHWCQFDQETEELTWNPPRGNIYRSETTSFRNTPPQSLLGILQDPNLSEEERSWRLYIKALEAENWSTASILFSRLSQEQKQTAHDSVTSSLLKLTDQATVAAIRDQDTLARKRFGYASQILNGLPPIHRNAVVLRVSERILKQEEEGKRLLALLSSGHRSEITAKIRKLILDNLSSDSTVGVPQTWASQAIGFDKAATLSVADAQNAIDRAKSWALDGENIFDDVSVTTIAAITDLLSTSNDEPIQLMLRELVSQLEDALPELKAEVRADTLRALAKTRTDEAAIRTWQELLETEFYKIDDASNAAALALESEEGDTFQTIIKNAIARFPEKSGVLNYQLGFGLRYLEADEEALPYFVAAKRNSSGLKGSFSFFGLASLLDDLGRTDEAWKVYQDMAAHEELIADHLAMAISFANKHGYPEAPLWISTGETKSKALRILAIKEQGEMAFARWRELVETEHTEAMDFLIGISLAAEMEKEDECREIFTAGTLRHPDEIGLLNLVLGDSLRMLGFDSEALPNYRAAVKENQTGPQLIFSVFGLANLLDDLGQNEEAWEIYQELTALEGVLPTQLAAAVGFAFKQGHRESEQMTDRMFKGANDASDLSDISWVLLEYGAVELAIIAAENSTSLAGDEPPSDAVAALAVCRWLTDDRKGAVESYLRQIELDPDYANIDVIATKDWPSAIKVPMQELLGETLKRYPNLTLKPKIGK